MDIPIKSFEILLGGFSKNFHYFQKINLPTTLACSRIHTVLEGSWPTPWWLSMASTVCLWIGAGSQV